MFRQVVCHVEPRDTFRIVVMRFRNEGLRFIKRRRVEMGFLGPTVRPVKHLQPAVSTIAAFIAGGRGVDRRCPVPCHTLARHAEEAGDRGGRRTTATFAVTMSGPKDGPWRVPFELTAQAPTGEVRRAHAQNVSMTSASRGPSGASTTRRVPGSQWVMRTIPMATLV